MEHWNRAYREAPEMFDAFTRAEDPDGHVVRRLLDLADLRDRTVLEIGCGTGRYTAALAGRADRYVALEKSPPMLALARDRFGAARPGAPWLLCADAERVPLRAGSVDAVIAGWVVLNLRRDARAAALVEIDRVLVRGAPGSATWLLENHWTGEFQELRGRRPDVERDRLHELTRRDGFQLLEVVATELRFPSAGEAERILGYLLGAAVRDRLRREPRDRFSHHVVILRRPAPR